MNVPMTSTRRTPSRLLDALRLLEGEKGTGRVGFRTREEAAAPHAGVVISLLDPSPALLAAAQRLPVEALEVPLGVVSALPAARNGQVMPFGVAVPGDGGVIEPAAVASCDWVRLDLQASLAGYGQTHPARFLTVPVEYDLRLAAALNSALADALVLQVPARDGAALTYEEAIRVRMWRDMVRKPLLLACTAAGWLLPAPLIRDLGVDAVLIAAGSERDLERVRVYRNELHTAVE
jgi:hypothetical protein